MQRERHKLHICLDPGDLNEENRDRSETKDFMIFVL